MKTRREVILRELEQWLRDEPRNPDDAKPIASAIALALERFEDAPGNGCGCVVATGYGVVEGGKPGANIITRKLNPLCPVHGT